MPLYAATLAPEIWQIIVTGGGGRAPRLPCVEFLPRRDRRTCLSTSKLLYVIAVKIVFYYIDIHFGSWRGDTGVDEGLEERELSRSWEILQHIARNPSFAANIKKLVVCPFSEGTAIFEQRCLIMALRELSNLRSFTWYNTTPELSSDVVTALVEFCPRLDAIHVPIPHFLHPELSRLNHLRSIQIQFHELSKYEDVYTVGNVKPTEFHALVSANTATLRELSIWGSFFRDTALAAVRQNLTHLELLLSSEFRGLDRLLQETTCLESLTIWPGMPDDHIYEALELNATALPRLTSLKLFEISIIEHDGNDNPVEVIANFIRGRHNLRRLDLGLICKFDALLPLFQGLQWQELESLDVFGFVLPPDIDANAALLVIEHCIPRGLSALSFSGLDEDICAVFVDAISDLQNLGFLYIHDGGSRHLNYDSVVNTLQRLELLGYNTTVMDVERQGDRTAYPTPSKWSTRKNKFRAVEDFGCGDWEWLMRYHPITRNDK
ncbi:hypothetical protein B0H21DRAFT_757015 [Amylocystis lapponica]|nr:hypothetical protein B0H21DRAFT_757015 [Amylocystis lapponica]